LLFRATMTVAEKENSQVLKANAWHHRSDAISSLVALLGIGGAIIGFPHLDPVASIIVSGLIFQAGYQILLQSKKELTDELSSPEIYDKIEDILDSNPDVLGYRKVRARQMGPFLWVDMTVVVHSELSVSAGHQIAARVKNELMQHMPAIIDVVVHVHPGEHLASATAPPIAKKPETISSKEKKRTGGLSVLQERKRSRVLPRMIELEWNNISIMKQQADLLAEVEKVLEDFPEVDGLDQFLCHYSKPQRITVTADIVVDPEMTVREAGVLAKRVRERILEKVKEISDVKLDLGLSERNRTASIELNPQNK